MSFCTLFQSLQPQKQIKNTNTWVSVYSVIKVTLRINRKSKETPPWVSEHENEYLSLFVLFCSSFIYLFIHLLSQSNIYIYSCECLYFLNCLPDFKYTRPCGFCKCKLSLANLSLAFVKFEQLSKSICENLPRFSLWNILI